MNLFPISIDNRPIQVSPGQTVLTAARALGLDIPTLCYLEKCGPLNSCLVCLVKVNGKLVPSCGTLVEPGMVIESETEEVHQARRTALELLFSDHVGDCLSPCHRLCPLGLNIPVFLRQIQARRLDEAIGSVRGTLPLAGVLGRLCHHPCEQGCRRGNWDDPAAIRSLEQFVADQDLQSTTRYAPPTESPTGRSVVVIGAGPTGLAAAYYLARNGNAVTLVDRNSQAGGSLRKVPKEELPVAVLDSETRVIATLGIDLKLGVELGSQVTIEGLARGFDAILVTTGEMESDAANKLRLPISGGAIKADPNTCQTPVRKVFAAGAAVKPVTQLVRAMAEGRAAAECVHRFLSGHAVRRPEKTFSSMMGRLSPGELKQFLHAANTGGVVSPCDRCAGLNRDEAATEAARCLHCDCRSSGSCLLQHYARVYNANANRYRSERREFEQQAQPCGVIFEPGKCILCGICVKLTELAREPVGLTFIGRGFEVRLAAPFDHKIEAGMRTVAEECVKHCPTGALAFGEKCQNELSAPPTSHTGCRWQAE